MMYLFSSSIELNYREFGSLQESERRATRKFGVSCDSSIVGAKSTTKNKQGGELISIQFIWFILRS